MKFFVLVFLLLTGCTQIPSKVAPVKHFDVNRYLGNWYEIARLDHSFEKGLTHVSAQYSINGNGSIKVINRGYLKSKEKWKEATGVA